MTTLTVLITLGVIFTLILGFSISGLLVITKLQNTNKVVKSLAFVLLGCVFSVFAMAVTIFIVWPA